MEISPFVSQRSFEIMFTEGQKIYILKECLFMKKISIVKRGLVSATAAAMLVASCVNCPAFAALTDESGTDVEFSVNISRNYKVSVPTDGSTTLETLVGDTGYSYACTFDDLTLEEGEKLSLYAIPYAWDTENSVCGDKKTANFNVLDFGRGTRMFTATATGFEDVSTGLVQSVNAGAPKDGDYYASRSITVKADPPVGLFAGLYKAKVNFQLKVEQQ